jgi:hypothetical protein
MPSRRASARQKCSFSACPSKIQPQALSAITARGNSVRYNLNSWLDTGSKADGMPISIPYLVDLEHDRCKPSNSVLNQLATVLQVDADVLFFLEGRRAPDLRFGKVDIETLTDALRTLRHNLDGV